MNRIRHKITLALVFFGTVVLAPAVLAQTSAGGTTSIQVLEQTPLIRAIRGLQLGQVFRPETGSEFFGIACGIAGAASPFDPAALAVGGAAECGQLELTAGIIGMGYTLEFEGAGTTAVANGSDDLIATSYILYNESGGGLLGPFPADGNNSSNPTDRLAALANAVVPFYIGAFLTLTDATSFGDYTGTYELLFTVVP